MLNRLGGTWSTDLLPGLASGAFFTMRLPHPSGEADRVPDQRVTALLRVGEAVQRFWLEASRLGLAMQPALAILAFAHSGETNAVFSTDPTVIRKARALAARFRQVLGDSADEFVFIGRIGEPLPRLPVTRSTRFPMNQLVESDRRTHSSDVAREPAVSPDSVTGGFAGLPDGERESFFRAK